MPTIVVRPRALYDLAEIWAYIADDSVDRADAFAALIDRKFQTLSRRPGIGRTRPELATDLRSFAVGNHVIFYLPIANGVEIVRVLHGARDLEAVLGDDAR
jgi:toxin ParE1/3/4